MEAVFLKLVRISLVTNWLILAVILLRPLLKKAPRWIICCLWALVAVRLVLPFSIESRVSLIPERTSVILEAVDTTLIHPEAMLTNTAPLVPQGNSDLTYISSASSVSVIPLIWCLGVLLMLGYLVISYFKMRYYVREAVPEKENIWLCDAVTTPFVLGILRPRIYLPSWLLEPNRAYVIAHEQSHLRWGDHWWKPLAFVLLSVFWFDPLMWVAYTLVCRDIEFACDERVIHYFGLPEKKAYSEALLECSCNRRRVLACPVAFGETAVVQRVRNVLRYKKPRFWVILISALVIVMTAIGFLTVPAETAVPDSEQPVSTLNVKSSEQAETDVTEPISTMPIQEEAPEINWEEYPDGIWIEDAAGKTFTAHVMIIRDPSRVYLAAASNPLSMDKPGARMGEAMEQEKAVAAVNAGPFFDDGSTSKSVGSVPCGLVLSGASVIWNDQSISEYSFVGFNKDNILIVAASITEEEARGLGIRDGCSGGPVLMVNGEPNAEVYNENSGYQPRTVIGQRADGAVVFVCADGRNPDSLGATYADMIDILEEYGVMNACALNGGSSSAMLYRDTDGRRYGEKGAIQLINRNSPEESPIRNMPTFWMVKPAG